MAERMLFRCGTVEVPAEVEELAVENLDLPFTPGSVTVSLRKPTADSDLITAFVVGEPSESGFLVQFSAPIPSTGYMLDWTAAASETVNTGEGLALGYADFFKAVRRFLGYGSSLTEDQTDEIDGYVQSGVRQFYYPPRCEGVEEGYEWSFLRQVAQVTTSAGVGAVAVPNTVGRVKGSLFYDGPFLPVVLVGEAHVLAATHRTPARLGRPTLACLRSKSAYGVSGQVQELVFAPVPDKAYVLTFCIEPDCSRLSEENPFPLGGPKYGELVLESCLSVAEQRANDEAGLHTAQFQRMLASAVANDRRMTADFFGPMSGPEGGHGRIHPFSRGAIRITYKGQVL